MQRRTAITFVSLALLFGLAGALLWSNRPVRNGGVDVQELNRLLSEDLSSSTLVPVSDRAALTEALRDVPHGPPPGLPSDEALPKDISVELPEDAVHQALLEHLAGFLSHLASGSAAEYESWMRSRGYALTDDPRIMEESLAAWKYMNGSEWTGDSSHEAIFSKLFPLALSFDDAQLKPVVLSLAEYGARIRYLRLSEAAASNDITPLFFFTPPEIERWVGYVSMGTRRHWLPPVSIEEVAQRDDGVQCAVASLGLQGSKGDWIPANLFLYYDPSSEAWHIQAINIVNSPNLVTTWEY